MTAVPVELTSHGADGSAVGDLTSDVAALRAALDEIEGPVTLLGHSYGGLVISEAADHPSVDELIYLAAFLPHQGENMLSLMGGKAPWLDFGKNTHAVQPGWATKLFYSETAPRLAAWAETQLQPQSTASFAAEVRSEGWRTVASTYIVCSQDRTIPAQTQHAWAQELCDSHPDSNALVINSDHSPFLSQPAELADVLVRGRVSDRVEVTTSR
jgi:pimeloyl-ACP methyl ester carboxylesterase